MTQCHRAMTSSLSLHFPGLVGLRRSPSSAPCSWWSRLVSCRAFELFQRQRWGNFWGTGWGAYGLFRAHRYRIELNWTVRAACSWWSRLVSRQTVNEKSRLNRFPPPPPPPFSFSFSFFFSCFRIVFLPFFFVCLFVVFRCFFVLFVCLFLFLLLLLFFVLFLCCFSFI